MSLLFYLPSKQDLFFFFNPNDIDPARPNESTNSGDRVDSPLQLSGNESLYALELSIQSQNPRIEGKWRIQDCREGEERDFHYKYERQKSESEAIAEREESEHRSDSGSAGTEAR